MKHDPNCAVVRSGDLRAYCDCGADVPAWYGGNKIPASYLAKFLPSSGNPKQERDLPDDIQNFMEQM